MNDGGHIHRTIAALRAEIVRLCIEEQELVHIVGPNLRRIHLVALGALELRRLRAEHRVRRLRRRAELLHTAIATLQTPDMAAIESQIEHDFAAWRQRIRTFEAEVNAANRVLENLMTDSAEADFKHLHRALVEKLHPDLAASPSGAELWPRVIEAHARHDTEALRVLHALAREITAPPAPETTAEESRLTACVRAQFGKLAQLRERQPYSLEPFLADNNWVEHRRDEIEAETAILESQGSALEMRLAQIMPVLTRTQPFGKN